ncbi:MAG: hypothetical protein GVY22_01770 [Gammaproteobacteria bacterium]|jgi:hypothetical protein|nr:hypothetical protein [Gammaproteobacteria bacterium]
MTTLSTAIDETRRALDRVDQLYCNESDPVRSIGLRQVSIEIAAALSTLMAMRDAWKAAQDSMSSGGVDAPPRDFHQRLERG